ncbi:AAA-like domain-containing protein [Aetokthonos hydrillicola Thurmond2011]|jgi:hypothetical protein|uniref:AAA-like domain-containing protein n=1 Tax=Aetokthonos hydrillicola Thurmond2011 TaxID=2712845 RepID=A0AAP5MD63_9CYAN|nr:AAA-like domain-containing protein [Aetokthonos hydrillicola]MBO3459670.1 adenylate cyclase [Aetokthonos hydrillicola CCALA 1050]MBW4589034.1 AAA-like domain-containing protein [Aetokthonos hydrillicola CCALA 1050]MDR9900107.1 AAA-like domain-containing protein [Aetokthonos hydrillicola Thurmond2011]
MIKILFLSADPTDTARLRLQREFRDIEQKLQQSRYQENFELKPALSTRPGDLIQAIVSFDPHIVHFCGHGTTTGKLCLEDESGETLPVDSEALAALFKLVADQVECVVLNFCCSEIQAQAIVQHIPFVIGMRQAITDQEAIAFAIGFYTGIGANRSIEYAFEAGCVQIQLQGIAQLTTPVILRKEDQNPPSVYIERAGIEQQCYEEVMQPGSLIRIKAPDKMGKTSLMNRIVTYAIGHNYQTVTLSFDGLVNQTVTSDLERFLKSFCIAVGDNLNLPNKLNEYWDNERSSIHNKSSTAISKSTRYFEKYLLASTARPLVLALNNVDLVFEQRELGSDFCSMLRGWNEKAKQGDSSSKIWRKLRLIIAHSTEYYASLDINTSPLGNLPLVVDLPEFTLEQVQVLVQRRGRNLTTHEIEQLMDMIGGHPFLLVLACNHIALYQITLETLLEVAPTLEGPFSNHLRELLNTLSQNYELKIAFIRVINSNEPVNVNPNIARLLQRLGIIKFQGNLAEPRCQLYRQYFGDFLQS